MKRKAAIAVLIMMSSELLVRFILGFPPLYTAHPTIEYLFAPNQSGTRAGKHYSYNSYGMRSPELPQHKRAGEFRLVLFGDSIINGGSLTDQSDIATSIIAKRTHWTVGNVSAGGWGPQNWLAYAREYGFFDADIVGLVLSSHDFADMPTFAPLDELEQISHPPRSALLYAARRYAPRLIPAATAGPPATQGQIDSAMASLREFLILAKAHARLIVFLHAAKSELAGHRDPGRLAIQNLCASLGVTLVNLSQSEHDEFYVDDLHLNESGQRALANAIEAHVIMRPE